MEKDEAKVVDNAEAKAGANTQFQQKTKEQLLEEQNELLRQEIQELKLQLMRERSRPSRSIYDTVCYYGCPNSKRVKKLLTKKRRG